MRLGDVVVPEGGAVPRGSLVELVAAFSGEPAEVYFSHMRDAAPRPVVDPGSGRPGSKIEALTGAELARVQEEYARERGWPPEAAAVLRAYRYKVDTSRFEDGIVRWHFWGAGGNAQASAYGSFRVEGGPPQLL